MKNLIVAILIAIIVTAVPAYSHCKDTADNQTKNEIYEQGYIDAARYDKYDPPADNFGDDYQQGYRDGANRYQPDLYLCE
jgi:type II secretory pathway pseudopilin PulG